METETSVSQIQVKKRIRDVLQQFVKMDGILKIANYLEFLPVFICKRKFQTSKKV